MNELKPNNVLMNKWHIVCFYHFVRLCLLLFDCTMFGSNFDVVGFFVFNWNWIERQRRRSRIWQLFKRMCGETTCVNVENWLKHVTSLCGFRCCCFFLFRWICDPVAFDRCLIAHFQRRWRIKENKKKTFYHRNLLLINETHQNIGALSRCL